MSLTGYTALLLLLGAITSGYAADLSECGFPNKTAGSYVYQLSISPETLYNDTVYTATVSGKGSVKVLLQALSNNTAVGTWSQSGANTCAGGPLFNVNLDANNSLVANWTSPSDSLPYFVDIIASITDGNVTYTIEKLLYAENAGSSVQPLSLCLVVIHSLGLLLIASKFL